MVVNGEQGKRQGIIRKVRLKCIQESEEKMEKKNVKKNVNVRM